MECDRVRKLLSEYIDNTLDEPTGTLIKGHIKDCRECNYEYVSLKAMVEELGSLSSLEAPKDFLEKVHERIESNPFEGRIRSFFSFPSLIKSHMELIALGITAVLIFIIFNMTPPENQVIVTPPAKDTTGSAMKTETGSKETSEGDASITRVIKEIGPIQLTLLLGTEPTPIPLSSENLRLIASGKGAEMPLDMTEFGFITEQDQETDQEVNNDPITDIIDTISLSEGRIISKEYKYGTDELEYISLEIPAINYHLFLERIKDIGTLKTPVPDLPEGSQEPAQIRIRLISSE